MHSWGAHNALEASGKVFCIALGGGGLPLQYLGFALSTMGGWVYTPTRLTTAVITGQWIESLPDCVVIPPSYWARKVGDRGLA